MSEQTSNPTSGQKVPKSKFRRKSRQEQTAASKLRMERRGEKLDAARTAYNEAAPLTPCAAAGSRNWSWGCTPWPWEG